MRTQQELWPDATTIIITMQLVNKIKIITGNLKETLKQNLELFNISRIKLKIWQTQCEKDTNRKYIKSIWKIMILLQNYAYKIKWYQQKYSRK